MELAVAISALIVAVLTLSLQYYTANKEAQLAWAKRMQQFFSSAAGLAIHVWAGFMISQAGIGIYEFVVSTEPLRRPEIVILFLQFANLGMYGFILLHAPSDLSKIKWGEKHSKQA
ncbi:hypothetical protein [Aquipseudomonas alcaligenes]|uniref:Uncharacterized protein n=1 Tax=Aquipseudomonas alcaligenes TaxID=43263 RepID=A0A1N6S8F5_AQUAC|nr:hypothetical protein [Pseudomonas alcaligenes]SIQ37364.1 hypothetical protein SAMN05878282_103426 [Pseudomonas alcaligenes]